MIHHFVQHQALSWLQPWILRASDRFKHQLQMAFEQAALVILVTDLQPGFWRGALKLAVRLRDHFCQMALQLFPGIPGRTRPDHT